MTGEPECFIRKDQAKSKKIRIGINPSSYDTYPAKQFYKVCAYVALIKAAKRMGFTVDAEMAYGGVTDSKLTNYYKGGEIPWSLRLELPSTMPMHVMAAYGSNLSIVNTYYWFTARMKKDRIELQERGYQTQDQEIKRIIDQEYDVCFHRLMPTDTLDTMEAFLKLQFQRIGVPPSDVTRILNIARNLYDTVESKRSRY
jgi:hypothetical protein